MAATISPLRAEDAPPAETKEERDARMQWWREARFGMFIHWGLYAQPAGMYHGNKVDKLGEWIMYDAKIPVAEYETYAKDFNPVKFDAEKWVGLAKAAGMKYIVITAKHCDGFAMYPSKASKYNIVDATPFKRDPMAELAKACDAQGIKLCFYYSHCWDWHEPNATGFINDWDFGPMEKRNPDEYFEKKALPQVEELASQYKPALFWFDVPDLTPERSREFLKVIRRHVPDCIVNDRVGNNLGDYVTPEQEIPKDESRPRLGNLHDHQRYLGLQILRQQLQIDRDARAQSDRYRQQKRQLFVEHRPDGRGRHSGTGSATAQGNGRVDEGQRRGDLRHLRQPAERDSRMGPDNPEARQALSACFHSAGGWKIVAADREQGKEGLSAWPRPPNRFRSKSSDAGVEIALPEKLGDPIATVDCR